MSESSTEAPQLRACEELARFILSERHVRSDGTVKQEAFIPHPHFELSVTRLKDLAAPDIWRIGATVAQQRQKNLIGRADTKVKVYLGCRLKIVSAPLPHNQNHANVTGWPPTKEEQKALAQMIAKNSIFFRS
ncbi:MAG: hypothetical protein CVU65_05695 [Deltaproteobacteria bacterium HGW-Deltaproteobacteria-22]|nr:MAG: hypothetical protein CVU65_05695 [Deltaproteobacteria bacterium HGW-Deltaproteobacteria-22]